MWAARTTQEQTRFVLVTPAPLRAARHNVPRGREKERRIMHQTLTLAHITHAHILSFATAQSLVTGKVVTFATIAPVLAAGVANPFSNVFTQIANWMSELALPVTIIGLAISGIFMVLHHRAARDMLVGTIVGSVILFGASPLAMAIQGLK